MPQSLYQGLHWRFIGPYRGGRVLAVAGVPDEPQTYYFGSVDGGVFKTTDGGTVWHPEFQHEPVSSIGALAVAPSDPRILYVGTGEADMRSDLSTGGGMFRSNDGGKTWHPIGLVHSQQIGSIWINPHNPNIVLVAAMGHAFGPNRTRGVFRTTDGGRHWTRVLYLNDHTGAIQLIANPHNPHELYAVLWNAVRPPWSQYPPLQGAGSGIWRSTDGGRHWQPFRTDGLPAHPGRIGLAIASNGRLFYAIVSARQGGGLYRSTDGGRHWTLINNTHRLWGRGWYFGGVYVSPRNDQVVYVLNTAMYESTDGGLHFTSIKGSPSGDDFHTLWLNPENPDRMIIGVDQGASISTDGGKTWTPWFNEPTAQIYRLTTDNRFRYRIYATQQDSGSLEIPSRSRRGILSNHSWNPTAGGEAGYALPDPLDPHIVFGTDIGGSVSRYDSLTGDSQNISPYLYNTFGTPLPLAHDRYPWVVPLAFSPENPHILYLGAQVLWQSDNDGESWKIISPDLTGARLPKSAGRPLPKPTLRNATALGYGTLYSLAPSPLRLGEIWVGTTNGRVWLTRNGGHHWQQVTPSGLDPWSRIDRIQASPFSAAVAYLAVDRHRVNDDHPYIYRTTDFGRHWTLVTRGIPSNDYVHVVRADPKRRGLLFAGTEFGLYVSFNHGHLWQPFNLNLPTTAIHDIAVHGNDLIVGTHGRGIWVLDDITSLFQDRPAIARKTAFLYQPETAYRIPRIRFRAEPFPPEVPHAKNPPAGAIVDYYLKSPVATPITLTIENSSGAVLRVFSSATRGYPHPLGLAPFPQFWKAPVNRLPDHAGLNRFVWHLRTRRPWALHYGWGGPGLLHNTPVTPQGPVVPPGRYRLILTVEGHRDERPLVVRLDPNSHLSVQEAWNQYRLASQAANAVTEMTAQSRALGSLVAEVRERIRQSQGNPHLLLMHFSRQLGSAIKALRAPILIGHFAVLEGMIDGPQRAPTQSQLAAFRRAQVRLRALRSAVHRIRIELSKFNRKLRQAGEKPLSLTLKTPSLLPVPAATDVDLL
jgi:hypothetical protein